MSNNLNYAEQRMQALRVTVQNNTFKVHNPEADFPAPQYTDCEVFKARSNGDLEITYTTHGGDLITYIKENNSKNGQSQHRTYKRIRIANPSNPEMKYKVPAGQPAWPYFPPKLVEKYNKGEKIDVLYLTEGPIKAWYCSAHHNVDMIGLASITCYREKETEKLYQGIVDIIQRCDPNRVVILWDADCLDISKKDLAHQSELTKRPWQFFGAIKNIQQLIKEIETPKKGDEPLWIHFMHPKRGCFPSDPKGIDDMLIEARKESKGKAEAVVQDLLAPNRKGEYFHRSDITANCTRLQRYFKLVKNDVDSFYRYHSAEIGELQFYFYRSLYQYVDGKDEVELVTPEWAQSLVWVGDEYFEIGNTPSAKGGRTRQKLYKRAKVTLQTVYHKAFQKYIEYHTGFVNIPGHFDYQRIFADKKGSYYNRYFPFEWKPEEGKFDTILGFVKHIFGEDQVLHPVSGQSIPRYELGLDYIQVLLMHPMRKLPVMILYSPENNTGKSKFCELLSNIFRNNVVPVSNSDLQSEFNSMMADKLLAYCEETLLERKKDTERIKALSTAVEITMNEKNVAQVTIDYFCKFIFCTNQRRMIYLSAQDERFWIIQVPVPKVKDPHLMDKMEKEIPAFIHFLKNRQMATKDESRMWFHPALVKTANFYDTVKINEPSEISDIRDALAEMFIEAGPDCKEIMMPMGNIREEFFKGRGTASAKWIAELLHDYLNVEQLKNEKGQAVITRGAYKVKEKTFNGNSYEYKLTDVNWKGRPYVFKREDFVDDTQYQIAI